MSVGIRSKRQRCLVEHGALRGDDSWYVEERRCRAAFLGMVRGEQQILVALDGTYALPFA